MEWSFSPYVEEPEPVPRAECLGHPCCAHQACVPLKERALCHTWYFARWQMTELLMPWEMTHELRKRFGKREFRYCGALSEAHTYEVLIRLDADGSSERPHGFLPESIGLKRPCHATGAWCLPCCWDMRYREAALWAALTREMPARFTFGDNRLPDNLLSDVKTAAACVGVGYPFPTHAQHATHFPNTEMVMASPLSRADR